MKYSIQIWFYVCFLGISPYVVHAGNDLAGYIASRAIGFQSASDLDSMISIASGRKLVLMGEASHGTHEYYAWRDSISRRLIAEHGFRFIAVEGDWAALYELNRYVKDMPGAAQHVLEVLRGLDRWPLWMWGNQEVVALAEWLRMFNEGLPDNQKVGFYGMDVYDEWRSIQTIGEVIRSHSEELYLQAQVYLDCMVAFKDDSWSYARDVAGGGRACDHAFSELFGLIVSAREHQLSGMDNETFFYLKQNARVAKNAEKFYRKSVIYRDASSWNARARHMHVTVERLLHKYGSGAKGIVWAHNTHIGDARFTDMGRWGQENIGHLSREQHGPDHVFLLGFTTYRGHVQAGAEWGARRQRMRIPRAVTGSMEYLSNRTGKDRFLLIFDDDDRTHHSFSQVLGHRAVGVVYDPNNDHRQFVPSIIPLRYDAFIFFRETNALNPLH